MSLNLFHENKGALFFKQFYGCILHIPYRTSYSHAHLPAAIRIYNTGHTELHSPGAECVVVQVAQVARILHLLEVKYIINSLTLVCKAAVNPLSVKTLSLVPCDCV